MGPSHAIHPTSITHTHHVLAHIHALPLGERGAIEWAFITRSHLSRVEGPVMEFSVLLGTRPDSREQKTCAKVEKRAACARSRMCSSRWPGARACWLLECQHGWNAFIPAWNNKTNYAPWSIVVAVAMVNVMACCVRACVCVRCPHPFLANCSDRPRTARCSKHFWGSGS